MKDIIGQRELRNDNARIMDAVEAGQTFVVTRNGTPVAELRPVQARRPRFVRRADLIAAASAGPHLDAARFRADTERAMDQGL
jgi:prevent-host-death family protein